jgi:hypothetical protein
VRTFLTCSILLALSIRVKSDLGAATGIALQTDSVWPCSEDDASGRDKAIVLAGARPRNKNQSMVLRGFEFLLNIVTGPESRAIRYPFTSVSYVRVDLPERRFQVAPWNWSVQNRLVSHNQVSRRAHYQNEWNQSQLRSKLEIVLRKPEEEGLTGVDLVILWLQIELPPDCMSIQYKIGPCVRMWTPCSRGICLDERIY